jgi:hypothetical protein
MPQSLADANAFKELITIWHRVYVLHSDIKNEIWGHLTLSYLLKQEYVKLCSSGGNQYVICVRVVSFSYGSCRLVHIRLSTDFSARNAIHMAAQAIDSFIALYSHSVCWHCRSSSSNNSTRMEKPTGMFFHNFSSSSTSIMWHIQLLSEAFAVFL